ncbi:SH2 domain-containing protein 1A-like, partial [Salarias fasciatus]
MAAAMPACYHGAISRLQCEELLGKKNKDGAFLIRDSETIQGALCLCVYKEKLIYTYRLMQTHTGSYTLLTAGGEQELFFKTLEDLINHYKKKNQGLAIPLRCSVKRKTALLIKARPDQRPDQWLYQSSDQKPQQRPDQSPAHRLDPRLDQRPDQSPAHRLDQGPDQRPDQRPAHRLDQRSDQRPD